MTKIIDKLKNLFLLNRDSKISNWERSGLFGGLLPFTIYGIITLFIIVLIVIKFKGAILRLVGM